MNETYHDGGSPLFETTRISATQDQWVMTAPEQREAKWLVDDRVILHPRAIRQQDGAFDLYAGRALLLPQLSIGDLEPRRAPLASPRLAFRQEARHCDAAATSRCSGLFSLRFRPLVLDTLKLQDRQRCTVWVVRYGLRHGRVRLLGRREREKVAMEEAHQLQLEAVGDLALLDRVRQLVGNLHSNANPQRRIFGCFQGTRFVLKRLLTIRIRVSGCSSSSPPARSLATMVPFA